MERKLELFQIAGYLPHGLYWNVNGRNSWYSLGSVSCIIYEEEVLTYKPILRPLSDLYRTITHNGKEIVPIVELAKICIPHREWMFGDGLAVTVEKDFGLMYDARKHAKGFVLIDDVAGAIGFVFNQYQLFDYLHELKIDYRGLIDAGLAVDVNTLDVNPYENR